MSNTTIKQYRYYNREEIQPGYPQKTEPTAWIYQGRSSHAFQEDTSYLGPFNGHVNGALVMKELENLEYKNRTSINASVMPRKLRSNDFPEPSGDAASSTRVIQRWMSHVLLTTTVNTTVTAVNPNLPGTVWFAPTGHFINNMMLKLSSFSDLLPGYPKLAFTDENYQKAIDELRLHLIQENMTDQAIPRYENFVATAGTLGGGKETGEHEQLQLSFVAMKRGEGLLFVAL
ncbi:uncharacterized protein H6S33_011157 [Morchella sextelata]|uniref:uncharacterized protein n=1 Tax=Morchella sextelata TaxID=1174677 RepID=UPI001D051B6F|nr:uncharacterized protein H6S33_011157 [Morchella sextelata]KAH0610730.1 hypothetical protein H6S33_011157 [Morchella sextelata]